MSSRRNNHVKAGLTPAYLSLPIALAKQRRLSKRYHCTVNIKGKIVKTFWSIFLLSTLLHAGVIVGEPFPSLTLDDQFETPHTIDANDSVVMISFEHDVSGVVNDYLKAQPAGYLPDHRARYVSDISAMPSIIATLFALPKMRDYPFKIMLNEEEQFAKHYDKKEGKLTIYRLNDGRVTAVEFIDPKEVEKLFTP